MCRVLSSKLLFLYLHTISICMFYGYLGLKINVPKPEFLIPLHLEALPNFFALIPIYFALIPVLYISVNGLPVHLVVSAKNLGVFLISVSLSPLTCNPPAGPVVFVCSTYLDSAVCQLSLPSLAMTTAVASSWALVCILAPLHPVFDVA